MQLKEDRQRQELASKRLKEEDERRERKSIYGHDCCFFPKGMMMNLFLTMNYKLFDDGCRHACLCMCSWYCVAVHLSRISIISFA